MGILQARCGPRGLKEVTEAPWLLPSVMRDRALLSHGGLNILSNHYFENLVPVGVSH